MPLISDCFFVARDRFVRLRFAQQIQMSLLRASLSVIFSKALKSRLNEMVSCKLLIVTRLVQSAQGRKAHGSRSFTINQALRRAKLRQRSFRQRPFQEVCYDIPVTFDLPNAQLKVAWYVAFIDGCLLQLPAEVPRALACQE